MGLIVALLVVIFLTGQTAIAKGIDRRVPPLAAAPNGAWCGQLDGVGGVGTEVHRSTFADDSVCAAPHATQSSRGWRHSETGQTRSGNVLLAAGDGSVITDPLNKSLPLGEAKAMPRWLMFLQLGMLIAAPLVVLSLWMKGVIRPNAFSRGKPKRDVLGLPAMVWFACAFLMFFSQMIGGVLLEIVSPGFMSQHSIRADGIQKLTVYGASCAAGALLVYFIVPRVTNAGFRARRADVLTGLGVLLLTMPILEAVNMLGVIVETWRTGETPDLIAHQTLRDLVENRHNPWTWAVMAAAVIGAPIVEELTFRVFLQSAVLRATGSHWVGIFASALVFALIHRLSDQPVPWHVLPTLFVLGAAAGIAFERTGRVLVPIIMHASFNALNVAMVFWVM